LYLFIYLLFDYLTSHEYTDRHFVILFYLLTRFRTFLQ